MGDASPQYTEHSVNRIVVINKCHRAVEGLLARVVHWDAPPPHLCLHPPHPVEEIVLCHCILGENNFPSNYQP